MPQKKRFDIKHLVLPVFLLLGGCAAIQQESTYKNPDTVLFFADKVLVVGMTPDFGARERFETRMQESFQERGVESVRSIDLFDVAFTASQRTEEELDKVEQQLLDKDFDAILFSKLVDMETRSGLGNQLGEVARSYDRFRDDYLIHQGIYYDQNGRSGKEDYYAETSLYCICVGKERELIWRSNVRITRTRKSDKVVRKYSDFLISSLEEGQMIIGHDPF